MNDHLSRARMGSIAPSIQAMDWPKDAAVWLERVPVAFLTDPQRADGIRLERFDANTQFDDWARGRIFAEMGELRWERQDGMFDAVFCGDAQDPAGFTLETEQDLSASEITTMINSYYLWGTRVGTRDLQKLGLDTQTSAFVELQIPRVLDYPVSLAARRVKVAVREFYALNGLLVYARFCGFEEES